jgi:hypothetical protein
MTLLKIALAAGAAILFTAGCAKPAPQPQASTASATSPPPATAQQSPRTSATAPDGLLQAIITTGFADHDQLVFEFGGTRVSPRRIEFVKEVREDPTDKPVPLAGTAFLEVVFDGTLDTAAREADPGKSQRYEGPKRLAPGLPVIKEVAVSGDFEFVLSFGVGLSRPACVTAKTGTGPARLVIDIWHDRAKQPADAVCTGTVKAG